MTYRDEIKGMSASEARDYLLGYLDYILEPAENWDQYGLNLTKLEGRLFNQLLLSRDSLRSKDALYDAIYFDTADGPCIKIVDVVVCNVRRKLADAKSGVEIKTHWGMGYSVHLPEQVPA